MENNQNIQSTQTPQQPTSPQGGNLNGHQTSGPPIKLLTLAGVIILLAIITGGYFLATKKSSVDTIAINQLSPTPKPSIAAVTGNRSNDVICPPNTKLLINYSTGNIVQPKNPNDVCELDITNISVGPYMDGSTSSPDEIQASFNQFMLSLDSVSKYPNLKILGISPSGYIDAKTEVELPSAIWQSKNLQALYLSYIPLKNGVLPPDIAKLIHLRKLHIYSSHIKTLTSQIGQLSELTELKLGVNDFINLPSEIGALKNLVLLDLSQNNLTSLPDSFDKLQNLKYLIMGTNAFVEFPMPITKLHNLEELDMPNNKLTSLPQEIGDISSIKKLKFRNWPISASATCGGAICQRDIISYREKYNQFTTFPDTMSKLSSLQELDLTNIVFSDNEKTHLKQLLPHAKIDFDLPEPLSSYPQ